MNHQCRPGWARAAKRFVEDSVDFGLATCVLQKVYEMNPVLGQTGIAPAKLAGQNHRVGAFAQGNLTQACRKKPQETAPHPIHAAVADFDHRLFTVRARFEIERENPWPAASNRPQPLPIRWLRGLAQQPLAFIESQEL